MKKLKNYQRGGIKREPYVSLQTKNINFPTGNKLGFGARLSVPFLERINHGRSASGLRGEIDYTFGKGNTNLRGDIESTTSAGTLPTDMATSPKVSNSSFGLRGFHNQSLGRNRNYSLNANAGFGLGTGNQYGEYIHKDGFGGTSYNFGSFPQMKPYGDANISLLRKGIHRGTGLDVSGGLNASYGTSNAPNPGLRLGAKGSFGPFSTNLGYDFTNKTPTAGLSLNFQKGGVKTLNKRRPRMYQNGGLGKEDISVQKNELVTKLESETFLNRYIANWKHVTGEDISVEDAQININNQIDYTKAGPDYGVVFPQSMGVQVPYYPAGDIKRGNATASFERRPNVYTGYEQSYEDALQEEKDKAVYPESWDYPWSIGFKYDDEGNIYNWKTLESLKRHEVGHTYNAYESPLWEPTQKEPYYADRPPSKYNEYAEGDKWSWSNYGHLSGEGSLKDVYIDIFGQGFDNWHDHAIMPSEISSAKGETEGELLDAGIWDYNAAPFSSDNLDSMLSSNYITSHQGSESAMHLEGIGYYDLLDLTNELKSTDDKNEKKIIQEQIDEARPEVERKMNIYFNELVHKEEIGGDDIPGDPRRAKKGGLRKLNKRRPRMYQTGGQNTRTATINTAQGPVTIPNQPNVEGLYNNDPMQYQTEEQFNNYIWTGNFQDAHNYINSPRYREKLVEQGYPDPDGTIAARTARLHEIRIGPNKEENQRSFNRHPDIFLNSYFNMGYNRPTVDHEIGHSVGGSYSDLRYDYGMNSKQKQIANLVPINATDARTMNQGNLIRQEGFEKHPGYAYEVDEFGRINTTLYDKVVPDETFPGITLDFNKEKHAAWLEAKKKGELPSQALQNEYDTLMAEREELLNSRRGKKGKLRKKELRKLDEINTRAAVLGGTDYYRTIYDREDSSNRYTSEGEISDFHNEDKGLIRQTSGNEILGYSDKRNVTKGRTIADERFANKPYRHGAHEVEVYPEFFATQMMLNRKGIVDTKLSKDDPNYVPINANHLQQILDSGSWDEKRTVEHMVERYGTLEIAAEKLNTVAYDEESGGNLDFIGEQMQEETSIAKFGGKRKLKKRRSRMY